MEGYSKVEVDKKLEELKKYVDHRIKSNDEQKEKESRIASSFSMK
ncbi:hypothetical protein [Alkalibacillus almallahensis]|nr:hypothetical protein [Alkalibacillus almallahensis]